ncbi:hypothetical protein F1737_10005 [Methanoplanus sp. FWC-SCC4]|uniref:Putative zinc ribbon domain-containing protein n=1 Tax=Methanochimaera problematica TaxID=2609417 RepID=A0AA97I3R9_9EURY|nr:zinc ribbon domain-containing protein [Methanoplanus sp. FWC-SCC4]WOF16993.1 hypothetical protein F1737_10005 [Methanoplanus sp. FWC-SCC4]
MNEQNEELFCQSCGIRIKSSDEQGTEKDGSKSPHYCSYCYMRGEFLQADITVNEMIELSAVKANKINVMPYDEAKKLNSVVIPGLKRWRE